MVRLRDDVDGCGCIRCQAVAYTQLQPSVAGAFAWASRFPIRRPSILLVFGAVGILQLGSSVGPRALGLAGAALGVLGAFTARGYVGILSREALGTDQVSARAAFVSVLRRLPAFVGAALSILTGLTAMVLVARVVGAPLLRAGGQALGLRAVTADLLLLVALAAAILYVLIRLCFVPEACFVGGYGPIESLRVSWTLTDLQLAKATALVVGFGLLLAAGVLFDLSVAVANRPVLLSVRFNDVTVVLRSFGLSAASGFRLAFDLLVTAVYAGVFVHQYTVGVFRW